MGRDESAHALACVGALGYDGRFSSGDEVQITTNSYGSSDEDNDGWEYDGQFVSRLQRHYAPSMQFMFSTGNGAPAYGTVAPPSPATGIGVGASTEFGSTGWDSITHTYQIMNNDVTPFSNRGPGTRGTNGADVVAGGHYGLYVDGGGAKWQPGDFRGEDYPGFAHIAYPGDVFTKSFTINNPGQQAITASIDDTELLLVDSVEFDFTVTPEMVAAENDNFYKGFNYFIPITATAGLADSSWYNIGIPAGTDLMIVRQRFPFDQFDTDGDYGWDNRFYLMVYNWEDINGDGHVWDDLNGNGVVNFVDDPTALGAQATEEGHRRLLPFLFAEGVDLGLSMEDGCQSGWLFSLIAPMASEARKVSRNAGSVRDPATCWITVTAAWYALVASSCCSWMVCSSPIAA